MSEGRIARSFAHARSEGRAALITYITAGDPFPEATVEHMHALVRGGADLIELGMPFSDPMADGPVIQQACERALAAGTTLDDVLSAVAAFRRDDPNTPVVLMGYLNPIEHRGQGPFSAAAVEAGVDGVLVVDMPPEESGEGFAGLDQVRLLAPTTSEARARRILDSAGGFVYYVSFKGVTGSKDLDVAEVAARVASLRPLTSLPIGVGFGIRNAEQARRTAEIADAIIVGSAIVQRIADAREDSPARLRAIEDAVSELAAAVRGSRAAGEASSR